MDRERPPHRPPQVCAIHRSIARVVGPSFLMPRVSSDWTRCRTEPLRSQTPTVPGTARGENGNPPPFSNLGSAIGTSWYRESHRRHPLAPPYSGRIHNYFYHFLSLTPPT